MDPNNGEANSRKRRMKEIEETVAVEPPPPPQPSADNFHSFQRQQSPLVGQSSQAAAMAPSQMMLEFSKPIKSFSALLTDEDIHKDEVKFIIDNHVEQLRRSFTEISWKHYNNIAFMMEEKTAKKLKEKDMMLNEMMIKNAELQKEKDIEMCKMMIQNVKLEQKALLFKRLAEAGKRKVNSLENSVMALKVSLNEAKVHGGGGGGGGVNNMIGHQPTAGVLQHEDAESSFTDPIRGVEPIRLVCKACEKQIANMMLWPCHHVALCTKCDARAKVCPVCSKAKSMSIELGFP